MKIRKFLPKDYEQVVNICIMDKDDTHPEELWEYVKIMFCHYYIEQEPDCCFVAVDDNDVPFGYIYGAKDFDNYYKNFQPYLKKISEINSSLYLADAQVEIYNHKIYKDEYPAHLHIDLLPGTRSTGTGSRLMESFCEYLKSLGIEGVMLIVGYENEGARRFYEKNGFRLLDCKKSGAAYGKKLTED